MGIARSREEDETTLNRHFCPLSLIFQPAANRASDLLSILFGSACLIYVGACRSRWPRSTGFPFRSNFLAWRFARGWLELRELYALELGQQLVCFGQSSCEDRLRYRE